MHKKELFSNQMNLKKVTNDNYYYKLIMIYNKQHNENPSSLKKN